MRPRPVPPRRNRNLDEEIDRNLKRAFEDLVNEPVPDRFKDLLKRLEESDAPRASEDKGRVKK